MPGIGANAGGIQEIVLLQAPNSSPSGGYSGGSPLEGKAITATFYTQWVNLQFALYSTFLFELGTVTGVSPSLQLQAYTRSAMGGSGVQAAIPMVYPETQNTIVSPILSYTNNTWMVTLRPWFHDIQFVATIQPVGSPSFTINKFRIFVKNDPR